MGNITFTIQGASAAEARQLALDLAETLAGMKLSDIPAETRVSTLDVPSEVTAAAKEVATAKAPTEPQPDPVTSTENVPTVVEIRAKAQEKGKTAEAKKAIKALLDQYECKSVSDVPEGKRAAFLAALDEL